MVVVADGDLSIANPARLSTTTITALAFVGESILVGEGNTLKCYDSRKTACPCLLAASLFEAQAIHGLLAIHLRDAVHVVVAWGGAQVRVLVLQVNNASGSPVSVQLLASQLILAEDWILTCKDDGQAQQVDQAQYMVRIAAVTAHNALLCLRINVDDQATDKLSLDLIQLSASSRVLLYAAALRWLSFEHVLISAGSALGDVIVWSCNVIDDNTTSQCLGTAVSKHYDYAAHDGSVFGLDITTLRVDGRDVLVLASCSDDRTIRIWNISEALDHRNSSAVKSDDRVPDETAAPCLVKTWAHTSRIWQIQFGETRSSVNVETQLFSFGEDGTFQVWTLHPSTATSSDTLWSLTHNSTFPNHVGKNIWSHAISQEPKYVSVATGGADGAVVLVDFETRASHSVPGTRTPQQWTKDDLASIITQGMLENHFEPSEVQLAAAAPKAYSFVTSDQVLMTTPGGHVLLGQYSSIDSASSAMSWRYLNTIPSRSYSVTAGLPSHGLGLIGDSSGNVYSFIKGRLHTKPLLNVSSKVGGLFLQFINNRKSQVGSLDQDVVLVVSRLGHAKANFFRLSTRELIDRPDANIQLTSIELDVPDYMVISSMLFQRLSPRKALLFLGSRNGFVACYIIDEVINLVSYAAHHADAVTALKWEGDAKSPEEISGYLLTTGRDSSYAIHSYTEISVSTTPLLVHRTVLPFGPNIEGFHFTEDPQPHLIFYGFHSKDFLVYDETEHNEVMRIDCGGAHRVWAFNPTTSQDAGTMGKFLWTRAAVLCMFSPDDTRRRWIKRGGHGREVKAVAVRPPLHDDTTKNKSTIIATGAEDTDIRLFSLISSAETVEPEMKCISIVSRHNTGLQQIQWSSDGQYLFSSAGCEEFFVWRVREVPFVQIGIACESAMPPASELPDLRIMGFDINQVADGMEDGCDAKFIITIVLSDSTLRVYSYTSSPRNPQWQLLQDGRHTTCCLTQVLHLNSSGRNSNFLPLLTASTDGRISFWSMALDEFTNPKPTARPHHTLKIHQNAITCTQLISLSSSSSSEEYLLITGGDDNALAFTRFTSTSYSVAEATPKPTTSTLLIPRAHTAALRAVVIESSKRQGTMLSLEVITSSNDQRIRTWHILFDAASEGIAGLEVKRGRNLYTALADVADMDVVRGVGDEEGEGEGEVERVVVCGVGVDVL